MDNKFFPIILGSDENAYATARCFYEEYGIKPLCLCSKPLIATQKTKILTLKAYENFDVPEAFVSSLLKELKARENEGKLLVIPCADYYTELMVKNYHLFEGRIANKFVPEQLFDRFATKDSFYKLCDEQGLYYPPTYICEYEKRLELVNDLPFEFPIVVKPENSNATEYLKANFEGKKKAYFFNNADEYLRVAKEMNKCGYKGKLIVQKMIKGGDTTSFVINSYSSKDGKVRFMCIGRILLEEYSPSMLGNYAAIKSVNIPELYKKVEGFLNSIGYVGFSNIDIKYDEEKGDYCFFELNPRHGRSSYYVRGAGYNLMKELTDDVVFDTQRDEVTYGTNEAIWASVPTKTLKKYIIDPEMKKDALALAKKKGITRTLKNPSEKNLIRYIKIKKIIANKARSFKLYFFDKNKM